LLKLAVKHSYNRHAMARELGVSHQAVSQRLQQPFVKETFDEIMDKIGLSDEFVGKGLMEGCVANRVISANIVITKSDDPTVEDQEAHSKTKDFTEVPDHPTRHKFFNTVLEVRQHIKRSNNAPAVSIVNVNYGYRGKDSESLTLRGGRERQGELPEPNATART